MHEKVHWHTVYMYRTSLIEMKTRLLIVEKIGRLSQDNDDVVIQKNIIISYYCNHFTITPSRSAWTVCINIPAAGIKLV